jgi:hypothetical protein
LSGLDGAYLPARALALACFAALLTFAFGSVLFGGGQFAFRDAAHFYYPLYYRVQQEWSAGRLPLWEPGENGGNPLLGSPVAAVLYPGKALFFLVPYAWGVRLYVVAHELLAFGAMLLLARSWGISRTGAGIAALCYAFSGPVLSDYFNVVYLVGAAWLPLGFRAADRWLTQRRPLAWAELAVVLAMQVLGGDPEAAYLTVLCAVGYALVLARSDASRPPRPWLWGLGLAAILAGWTWAGPYLASWIHGRGPGSGQLLLCALWVPLILLFMATRSADQRRSLRPMFLGLAGACALASVLAAAQILPAAEQVASSVRWAGTGLTDLYDSSLLPYRVAEWVWPNVFGTFTTGNHYWMALLPPAGAQRPWPLSLYLGALPLVLALSGSGFRGGPAWRGWMTAVALLSLLASLGEFAGPARWLAAAWAPDLGDDSFYGFLATLLPGFRLFRLPFKLLVFTSLALAVLAGAGWDRVLAGRGRRRAIAIAGILLAISIASFLAVVARRGPLITLMAAHPEGPSSVFGPLDARGATAELLAGLAHGVGALAASLLVLGAARRHPGGTAILALPLLTLDLARADGRLVITIPQDEFEREPAIVGAIRRSEEARPGGGPFRVHRLASWVPPGWSEDASPERLRELVRWEIDTLQPRFGLLHGVSYLLNDESKTEQYAFWKFFQPSFRMADERLAATLGAGSGQRILWHPRPAFDLWGARYFILPSYPAGWQSEDRSYAAFLDQTELIYPDPASLEGPAHEEERRRWLRTRDVQVRRNKAAFPRAWVVHQAHLIPPLESLKPSARESLVERLRHGLGTLRDRDAVALDLGATAHVETARPQSLAPYLPGTAPDPAEHVTVSETSTTTVLQAELRQPGLIVLADVFAPGWRLTIDGRPAPILRANVLMRAAAVPAGSHTLVYTYDPLPVRVGILASAAGWLVCLGLFAAGLRKR